VRVKRTFCTDEIERVIYHPEVIRLSTESGKGKIDLEGICWIGAYVDDEIVGVFAFEPMNKVSLDSHCYFLPEHRKKVSDESYKLAVSLVFNDFDYKKLVVRCINKVTT